MFNFQNVGIKIFVLTVANKNKYEKNYLGGLQGAYSPKTSYHFIFLIWRGIFEKVPRAQFMLDFQNVDIKIFVWTVANKNKYQKNYLGGLQGAYPPKTSYHFIFLIWRGIFEKIPRAQFMFDFQNVGIKIFVWTVANKNKYQKNYLGGLQGAYPPKTSIFHISYLEGDL